jgi:hypothetical protein
MIYGTEHFVRPAQAHAPTLAVILNLFQDLLAIVISRDKCTPAGQNNRRASGPGQGSIV